MATESILSEHDRHTGGGGQWSVALLTCRCHGIQYPFSSPFPSRLSLSCDMLDHHVRNTQTPSLEQPLCRNNGLHRQRQHNASNRPSAQPLALHSRPPPIPARKRCLERICPSARQSRHRELHLLRSLSKDPSLTVMTSSSHSTWQHSRPRRLLLSPMGCACWNGRLAWCARR